MAINVPLLNAERSQISVVQIFVSHGHDYWTKGNSQNHLHGIDEINQVECLPGKGLKGDRYSKGRPNRIGQVTFIADEAIKEIRNAFDLPLLPSQSFVEILLFGELIYRNYFRLVFRFKASNLKERKNANLVYGWIE